jgi:hypothetical protein
MLQPKHRHLTGGLSATESNPIANHTHPHGVKQAADSNQQTAQGGTDNHRHFYSNWYADTGNGNTGTPNQTLPPYTSAVWLRRLSDAGNPQSSAIVDVSAGGTLVNTSHVAFTLCTNDWEPVAADLIAMPDMSFNWIAIGI